MERYLICRPRGGLNDTLCEIETCWRYAAKFGRILMVDTSESGLLENLSSYLEVIDPGSTTQLEIDPGRLRELNQLKAYPEALTGRLDSYSIGWTGREFADKATGALLSFDFAVDHDAAVLLHQQSRGGTLSVDCLARLRFRASVAQKITARLPSFEEGYDAIHVRNTDLKTDYVTYFQKIRRRLRGRNVLLCSDDFACIAYARRFFVDSNVFTVSDIPDLKGERLHRNATLDRHRANLDSFVDLIALAGAKRLYFARRGGARSLLDFLRPSPPISGFSGLADGLHRRRDLARGLLAHADVAQHARGPRLLPVGEVRHA